MGVEGRDQGGRAVKTSPGAREADSRTGRCRKEAGHTCRTAMSGAARSEEEQVKRGTATGADRERACGRKKARRGGHEARTLWRERNRLR